MCDLCGVLSTQTHEIKFRSESIYVFFYSINYATTIIFYVITSGRKAIKPKRIAVARASIWRTVCIASRSWRPQNVFQRIRPRCILSIHLVKLAMIYVKSDRPSLCEEAWRYSFEIYKSARDNPPALLIYTILIMELMRSLVNKTTSVINFPIISAR